MDFRALAKEVEYVPEWNGNASAEQPVKFILKHLTNAERSRCFRTWADGRGNVNVEPDQELLVKYGVVRIENLSVNGEAITDHKSFAGAVGLGDLFSEVAVHILIMSSPVDRKNSA
jgi:hypothetical protein